MVFLHTAVSETEIGWQNKYNLILFPPAKSWPSKQVLLCLFRRIHVGQMAGKSLQT